MKALSVWEPWASLLACGHKWYETRSWTPPADYLKIDVAIHAGKGLDGMRWLDRDAALARICDEVLGRDHPFAFGSILAVGRIAWTIATDGSAACAVTEREKAMGDWSPGRWAWRFSDVRTLARPVPCRGRQKFFTLTDAACFAVQAQL